MKKSRKILCMVVGFAVSLSVTACKPKTGPEAVPEEYKGKPEEKYFIAGKENPYKDLNLNGQTITIASWWDPKPADKGTSEVADKTWARIEYLEKQYNCKIKYQPMVQAEMLSRITTSVESGSPVFDFGYVTSGVVPTLITKGYLEAMENVTSFNLTEVKWPKFYLKLGEMKGKHYTFDTSPIAFPRQVVLWNKTMFEKNALPNLYDLMKDKQWNWDKMLEISKTLTKDTDGDSKPDVFGLIGYADLMSTQMIMSNNAELVSVDTNGVPSFQADSANSIEAIQFLIDLNTKYKVMGEPEAPTWDYYIQAFKDGKVAMAYMELYMVGQIKDMKDDYGIVAPPMGPKATTYSSRVGECPVMAMLANNPKKQEVGYILDLLSEELPGMTDSWKSQYETFLRDDESINIVKEIADNYSQFDNSFFYPAARVMLNEAVNNAWYGDMTPAESFGAIKSSASKAIDDQYKSFQK